LETMPSILKYLFLLVIPFIGLILSNSIKNSRKDRWIAKDKYRFIRFTLVLVNVIFILLFVLNAFQAIFSE
jgi:hypothetical protein